MQTATGSREDVSINIPRPYVQWLFPFSPGYLVAHDTVDRDIFSGKIFRL